jgi:hypothetical protein
MALRLNRYALPAVALLTAAVIAAAPCAWYTSGAEKPATKPDDSSAEEPAEEKPLVDPLGPNGACYVCHIPFLTEHLARSHMLQDIGCVNCHGLSAAHANDENIGATKPDITFTRDEIDKSCAECHDTHDVPANQVVARFVQRKLSTKTPTVCVDCHGSHKIEDAADVELSGDG